MFTPRRNQLSLAIIVFIYSLMITLLSPSFESAPAASHDAPVAFNPLWRPSVASPVPDSARLFTSRPHTVSPQQVTTDATVTAPSVPARQPQPAVKVATPRTPVPSRSTATETAIAYAMSKLGKPYVWGATGPNAFDCSGLVQAAFRAAGINLPRTTHTIIAMGTPIGRSALQRGDLVWPTSGHVGIYLGDGMFINAPQPGDVVKISKLYAFYAGRRL